MSNFDVSFNEYKKLHRSNQNLQIYIVRNSDSVRLLIRKVMDLIRHSKSMLDICL